MTNCSRQRAHYPTSNDPIVLLHAQALLASHDDGLIDYLDADLRDTETILDQASRTLDFSRPVTIMLIAILHRSAVWGGVARKP